MDVHEIEARPREVRGSRACRRLRRQDLVPAVLYGRGQPNLLLTLRAKDVEELLAERAMILEVSWDGQQETAQLKDIQFDAFGDEILHVDLTRISLDEAITVNVPVETHGDPVGVEEGGIMELVQYGLDVECLPTQIPDSVTVEVSELNIGDNLTVGDLTFPEGVTPVARPDLVVVTVVPPPEEEEEEEAPEELIAEPELIGREPEEAEELAEEEEVVEEEEPEL